MSSLTPVKKNQFDKLHKKVLNAKKSAHYAEAITFVKKMLELDPKNPSLLMEQAELASRSGDYLCAIQCYVDVLNINPNNSEAWRNLGLVQLSGIRDVSKAITSFSKSLSLNPEDGLTYYYLGLASKQLLQFDDSIELFEQGLKYLPEHGSMRAQYGACLAQRHRFAEAQRELIQAIKLAPNDPTTIHEFINNEKIMSLSEEEKKLLQDGLDRFRHDPGSRNIILLYEAEKLEEKEDYEGVRNKLLKIKTEDLAVKGGAFYKLANTYHRDKDYETAFSYYQKANDAILKTNNARSFDHNIFINNIKRDLADLDEATANKIVEVAKTYQDNKPYKSPYFLLGFPRSGNTLTGQILHMHPELLVNDERGAIDLGLIQLAQKHEIRGVKDLANINQSQLNFLIDLYDEKQGGAISANPKQIFIDKMPLNIAHAAFLYTMFPETRFLRIRRHPLDSVLSCYMQNFRLNSAMLCMLDLEKAATLYKLIHEYWKLSKQRLPINYYEFRYEDLVDDFDNQVTQILEFIGVDWGDHMRDFHQGSGAVPRTLTPSRTQVNKKLYKDAKYRWKNYREHLKPAIEILEPTIIELGYEID